MKFHTFGQGQYSGGDQQYSQPDYAENLTENSAESLLDDNRFIQDIYDTTALGTERVSVVVKKLLNISSTTDVGGTLTLYLLVETFTTHTISRQTSP